MGLRNHLISLPKCLSEAIRKVGSKSELIDLLNEKCPETIEKFPDISGSKPEILFFRLGEEIYDLGPVSNIEDTIQNSIPLFENEDLQQEYEPIYSPRIVFREGYLEIIDSVRRKIADYYHCYLKVLEDNRKDKIPALMSFLHLREKSWSLFSEKQDASTLSNEEKKKMDEVWLPYDLNPKEERIVNASSYEYQIFEMVRIYKTIDFDRFDLLLIQW